MFIDPSVTFLYWFSWPFSNMILIHHPFATDGQTHTHTRSSNPLFEQTCFGAEPNLACTATVFVPFLFLHWQDINSSFREKNHLIESQLQPIPAAKAPPAKAPQAAQAAEIPNIFDPNFNFDEWPGSSEPYLSDHSYLDELYFRTTFRILTCHTDYQILIYSATFRYVLPF